MCMLVCVHVRVHAMFTVRGEAILPELGRSVKSMTPVCRRVLYSQRARNILMTNECNQDGTLTFACDNRHIPLPVKCP
jgi:hypothetical protein